MSIFDQLGSLLGGQQQTAGSTGLGGLFQTALQDVGGYQGVIDKLNQAGLGNEVNSWLATNGKNLPVSASQIEAALGNQQLQQLAKSFGVPLDQISNILAEHLPNAVDQASPTGTLQTPPH